jgi:hypothetical protein
LPFNLPATLASRNFTEQAGVEIADFIAVPSCVAPVAAGVALGAGAGAAAGGVAAESAGLPACATTKGDVAPAVAVNSISAANAAIPDILMPSPPSNPAGPDRPIRAFFVLRMTSVRKNACRERMRMLESDH